MEVKNPTEEQKLQKVHFIEREDDLEPKFRPDADLDPIL